MTLYLSFMLNFLKLICVICYFYFPLSDLLHGEQPRGREDRRAPVNRQGGRARAHSGRGPFPSCCSSGLPLPARPRQHNHPCPKHRPAANCSAHPRPRYRPLHHSSSSNPQHCHHHPKPAPTLLPTSSCPQSSAASSAKHRAAR